MAVLSNDDNLIYKWFAEVVYFCTIMILILNLCSSCHFSVLQCILMLQMHDCSITG